MSMARARYVNNEINLTSWDVVDTLDYIATAQCLTRLVGAIAYTSVPMYLQSPVPCRGRADQVQNLDLKPLNHRTALANCPA